MARRKEPAEEALRDLIAQAVARSLDEDEAEFRDGIVADVLEALRPVIGAAAERRRNEGALRDAFRDGFRTGQSAGRFARWHGLIWKHSEHARRLREMPSDSMLALQSRYSQYNFN